MLIMSVFTEKEEAVSPQSQSLELAAEGGHGLLLGELCELPGQHGAEQLPSETQLFPPRWLKKRSKQGRKDH